MNAGIAKPRCREGLLPVMGALVVIAAARPVSAQPNARICIGNDTPVWVPPVYETRTRIVTVPAIYMDVERRVWREPVYEIRRVMVPAKVVTRKVPRYTRTGRRIGFRLVERVVRPAHNTWKEERILVRPGRWVTVVEQVLVEPARTKRVRERVVVREGHWADRPCRRMREARPHHGIARLFGGFGDRHNRFNVALDLDF